MKPSSSEDFFTNKKLSSTTFLTAENKAQTFWLPAGCKPTTSLEKIASSIFNFHANNLRRGEVGVNNGSLNVSTFPANSNDTRISEPLVGHKRPRHLTGCSGDVETRGDHLGAESGVEWWVQIRKEDYHADLGMPFHWDKDERLLELKGALVCPAVSTVTYLTDFGAPTVVFKVLLPYKYDPIRDGRRDLSSKIRRMRRLEHLRIGVFG